MQILLIIGATLVAHFAARIALQHAQKIADRSHNVWDDALIASARRPLPLLIWLSGTTFALNLLQMNNEVALLEFATPARVIGAEICFAWFLFKLIKELSHNIIARSNEQGEEVDHTTIDGLSKVARIVVIV
ncbi:MAG: mechanosensitive ion channel family protein, partial [Sideroxydans sp.]|nr:mechanosensitive ion channel family protein [Sideroxydans sp.]